MDTHTLMFILLIVMLALRFGFSAAGKFGKPVVGKGATRRSAAALSSDPVTLIAPDPAPTDAEPPLWRGAYGADEDWA